MGILIFTIFISYSCIDAFLLNPIIIWSAIIFQAAGIVAVMRSMMRNRTTVRPYLAWNAKKTKTLQHNWTIRIISFILLSMLGAIHFLIVNYSGKDLMPLVYDYGIGGAGALILQFLLSKNWHIGLSDKGIIFGSKYDSKLVEWKEVSSFKESNGNIYIYFRKKASLKSIVLSPQKRQREIVQLIAQSIGH